MFVVNLPEAPSIIPCINRSCVFILASKKHPLSQCDSKKASAWKIKELMSINVNQVKPQTTKLCFLAKRNSKGCESWPCLCRGTEQCGIKCLRDITGWQGLEWIRERHLCVKIYTICLTAVLLLVVAFALSMTSHILIDSQMKGAGLSKENMQKGREKCFSETWKRMNWT